MKCSVFHPGGRVFFFALCVILILTLALGIFMASRAAEARQPVKVHR